MKALKKLNVDRLYKIELKLFESCHEYCLVDANDGDEIYAVLEEEDLKNG